MIKKKVQRIQLGTCQVCHLPILGGKKVYLGFTKERHTTCFPGSIKWVKHYPRNPHTPEGDLIYARAINKQMGIGE